MRPLVLLSSYHIVLTLDFCRSGTVILLGFMRQEITTWWTAIFPRKQSPVANLVVFVKIFSASDQCNGVQKLVLIISVRST